MTAFHFPERLRRAAIAARRIAHRGALPTLDPLQAQLVRDLAARGVAVTHLDYLPLGGSAAMLDGATDLFDAHAAEPPPGGRYVWHAPAAELIRATDVIRWGLDPWLLELVEAYIGLPPAYRGVTVRRDIAGGRVEKTRLYHMDAEDVRIVKIIVYAGDVGPEDGPYECIPAEHAPRHAAIGYSAGRVAEATMAAGVPRDRWKPCTGRRGTVVVTDTCRVFHRGRVARTRDRRALFFCYNGRRPLRPEWCAPLHDWPSFSARCPGLSARQRAAIGLS